MDMKSSMTRSTHIEMIIGHARFHPDLQYGTGYDQLKTIINI